MLNTGIDKIVEETIQSMNGARRAQPRPYLLTRIFARLEQPAIKNTWTEIGSFLSRPQIAWAIVLILLITNLTIIITSNKLPGSPTAEQSFQDPKDEFATNNASIYDNENFEPWWMNNPTNASDTYRPH